MKTRQCTPDTCACVCTALCATSRQNWYFMVSIVFGLIFLSMKTDTKRTSEIITNYEGPITKFRVCGGAAQLFVRCSVRRASVHENDSRTKHMHTAATHTYITLLSPPPLLLLLLGDPLFVKRESVSAYCTATSRVGISASALESALL